MGAFFTCWIRHPTKYMLQGDQRVSVDWATSLMGDVPELPMMMQPARCNNNEIHIPNNDAQGTARKRIMGWQSQPAHENKYWYVAINYYDTELDCKVNGGWDHRPREVLPSFVCYTFKRELVRRYILALFRDGTRAEMQRSRILDPIKGARTDRPTPFQPFGAFASPT